MMTSGMTYLLSLLYSGLAFAEILVLLASALALLVLAVRQLKKAIERLLDAAVDAASPSAEPRRKTLDPLGAAAGHRGRKIPGAHNDRF